MYKIQTEDMITKFVEHYENAGYLEQLSLADALKNWADEYKGKVALVDQTGSLTYEELYQSANLLGQGLIAKGIKKGDNVLVQLPNNMYFVKVCFSLFIIGARPILLLPTHREKDITNISKLTEPVAMIIPSSFLGHDYKSMAMKVAKEQSSISLIITDESNETFISLQDIESEMREQNNDLMEHQSSYKEIALFLLSGGTTGTPKVIPKLHTAYLYNAKAAADHCRVTQKSTYLAVLSIAHDYPLCSPGVMGTLCKGGKVVLSSTSTFDEVLDWIEKERVTFTSIVPVIANLWVESLALEEHADLSSIDYILLGAAKLEKQLALQLIKQFECKLIQGYGLGEGITCFTSPNDDIETIISCQGRPISKGDQFKIVDENNNEVSPGEPGELIQKGPYTFLGYFKSPEINRMSFTEDGFLKTGDKARVTSKGNIQILGRVKEQINRAGENVIPSEVESYLLEHDEIIDASVVGVADMELSERICAFVVKKDRELSLIELCKFLIDIGVTHYKLPDQLVYVDAIPYINVGKSDKKKLVAQYLE
ncbi:(2,3-dihydroxybenzoyl)adenylate synthase [Lysinibacillus sp. NPDC093190]|uniref:(2,3-dihydroxybenzoyl)adenylate synthase n=1 Tax=Lysinibacillus sp. NPDC093190 TaxID=3390575 RepID=UPI003D04BB49